MVLGIDNGTTGSITILHNDGSVHSINKTPIRKILKYTKKVSHMNIIVMEDMIKIFESAKAANKDATIFAWVERPLINPMPMFFKASLSGIVSYVLTMLALEKAEIPYEFIDSKNWQSGILPEGTTGRDALKEASVSTAKRLFPKEKIDISVSDSVLIAEYFRRKSLGLLK